MTAALERLRREAIDAGLLAADDPAPVDDIPSEATAAAIEGLLERLVRVEPPDEASCRRFHAANPERFAVGERARLRHILFAVTPGVDVAALRARAEACLIDLRAKARDEAGDRFAAAAREWSNCPSGAQGGELGMLAAADCASEFAREVFGHSEVGVLPRLVTSRFGFHVVEVLEREPGRVPPYEDVREAVRMQLERQATVNALRRHIHPD
jgi:peptidyl-prolyl cis-trans isomerase C